MTQMMPKVHHLRFAFIAMALFLTCTALAKAQTLTVWVGDGEPRLREYEVVARLFEEQNPGVTVEIVSQSGGQAEIMQKIILAIIGGAPPDVTWLEGSGVIEFAAQGLLVDLTRALDGLNFAPSDTQEMTFNGRMWAVPYHTAFRGLFKRIDYFEQAGLDPHRDPTSLDELYEWNQALMTMDGDGRITRAGYMPWVGNWGSPAWIWAFGGDLVEIDGSHIRPTASLPQNVSAFEWIRGWAQSYGNTTPVAGGFAGFQNGTTAMSAESTSVVTRLIDADVSFAVGRMPHPEGGRNGTWGGGTAVGVPINAPHMDLALKLARFFGETEVQIRRFEAEPVGLPANWEALLTVGRDLPDEFNSLLDQLPEARPRTPLWIEYYVQQLNPAMNQVVAGTTTPQQALDHVQRTMEARFAEVFGR